MFLNAGTETSREFTALYSWWASLLILQLLSVTWLTGRVRVRTETIHSAEDRVWLKNRNVQLHVSGGGHPELDRIRSGHFNDLAIVMPYLIIALFWLNTSPSTVSASVVLRAFPILKIVDAALYSKLVDGSDIFRHVCLAICYSVVLYMTVSCLLYYYCEKIKMDTL